MIIGLMANVHVATAWQAFPLTMAISAAFNEEAGSLMRHTMMGTEPDMKEKIRNDIEKLRSRM